MGQRKEELARNSLGAFAAGADAAAAAFAAVGATEAAHSVCVAF